MNRLELIYCQRLVIYNNSSSERGSAIIIPVVVHVVHRNTHPSVGSGTNISNAQIEDQIRILNEDYSKTNSEFPNPPRSTFKNIAGNANLQFLSCLARSSRKSYNRNNKNINH